MRIELRDVCKVNEEIIISPSHIISLGPTEYNFFLLVPLFFNCRDCADSIARIWEELRVPQDILSEIRSSAEYSISVMGDDRIGVMFAAGKTILYYIYSILSWRERGIPLVPSARDLPKEAFILGKFCVLEFLLRVCWIDVKEEADSAWKEVKKLGAERIEKVLYEILSLGDKISSSLQDARRIVIKRLYKILKEGSSDGR